MNRLQLWSKPDESPAGQGAEVEQAILSSGQQREAPHALFAPLHYEPNYAYPLIVWLHGPHDNEFQLQRVMPALSMRNYVAVGPRAPQVSGRGFTWSGSDLELVEQAVFASVDAASQRYHVAPRRVFLAGLQCGGSMAFRVGLRNPGAFAGVLSVGGPFPLGQMPLAHLEQARQLPLLIAQGRYSQAYPLDRTCDELRLFHSAGLAVTLRQYPCGDELTTQMLRDINSWIMERVTGVPAVEAEVDSLRDAGDWN